MATSLDPFVDRLVAARAGLAGLRPAVIAGDPWPLADHFGVEPEAVWGPPEVLAHLVEMFPYWRRQIEAILAAPSGPVAFGRTQEDPDRIAAIERNRKLPLDELFDAADAGIEPYLGLLARIPEADVTRTGLHPTRGVMTIPAILERSVVSHAEEHVVQIQESLARG